MKVWSGLGWIVGLIHIAAGCGDDTPEPYGKAEGGTSGVVMTTSPHPSQNVCSEDAQCPASTEPCLRSRCIAAQCVLEPVTGTACRPSIEVEFPARGQTLRTDIRSVEVRGRVERPTSGEVRLTLGGASVVLGEDGQFRHPIEPVSGVNTLVFEVTDELGQRNERVQSFTWSHRYHRPTSPPEGILEEALVIYLDQESLDDGDHSRPADDMATVLEQNLEGIDLSTFVDPQTPLLSVSGYALRLTALTHAGTLAHLEAFDGGLAIHATLQDVVGTFAFDCLHPACSLTGGDGGAQVGLEAVHVFVDTELFATDTHTLAFEVADVRSSLEGVWVRTDNPWLDGLLAEITPYADDILLSTFESQLNAEIRTQLVAALADRFDGLGLSTTLVVPGERGDVLTDVQSDFARVDIHDGQWPPRPSPAQGAALFMRGGFFSSGSTPSGPPSEHLGVPDRGDCGGGDLGFDTPRTGAMELTFSDDFLNQFLYQLWVGGLFTFPVHIQDLTSDIHLDIQSLSAPTLSDCNPQDELRMHIGDLRLVADVTLLGESYDFESYAALSVAVGLDVTPDGLMLKLGDIRSLDIELRPIDEAAVENEALLRRMLEDQLSGALLDSLGGDGAPQIPLPQFGSTGLTISAESSERRPGQTVIFAHL